MAPFGFTQPLRFCGVVGSTAHAQRAIGRLDLIVPSSACNPVTNRKEPRVVYEFIESDTRFWSDAKIALVTKLQIRLTSIPGTVSFE